MAVSKRKTCLAILRGILGPQAGQEKRFGSLIGKSVSWLKKASCGQITIPHDVRLRISYETGVNLGWLSKNDPMQPPTDGFGQPYTRASFDKCRESLAKDYSRIPTPRGGAIMASLIFDLLQINAAAMESNRGRLLALKLDEFNFEAEQEFGKIHFRKNKEERKRSQQIVESLFELFKDPPEFVKHIPSRHDPDIPWSISSGISAFIHHGQQIEAKELPDKEAPERILPIPKAPRGRKPQANQATKPGKAKPSALKKKS